LLKVSGLKGPFDWYLTSQSGQTLTWGKALDENEIINLANIPSGLYLLKCATSGGKTYVGRVVILP